MSRGPRIWVSIYTCCWFIPWDNTEAEKIIKQLCQLKPHTIELDDLFHFILLQECIFFCSQCDFLLIKVAHFFSLLFTKKWKLKANKKDLQGWYQGVHSTFVEFVPYAFLAYSALAQKAATADRCPGSPRLTILKHMSISCLFLQNNMCVHTHTCMHAHTHAHALSLSK